VIEPVDNFAMTQIPRFVVGFWFTVLGTLIGSYLNVVVYRLPRGLSTVKPRSSCPRCGKLIAWFDNIPILSYLILRGRCRNCSSSIHWRYPLVEATCGLLFLACYLRFGLTLDLLPAALLCSMLLALALIDAEHFLLPNRITYPGIVLGMLCSLLATWTNPLWSTIGAVVGAGLLLLLILIWHLVRNEQGMGYGDVKMLAMLGAFLGLYGMAVTLFIASLAGSLIGLGLILSARGTMRAKLPFGVFLSIGGVVALLTGQWMVDYYLGFF
jgi:leader peptidase (prepilin peptidase)/N-methyltransferase